MRALVEIYLGPGDPLSHNEAVNCCRGSVLVLVLASDRR